MGQIKNLMIRVSSDLDITLDEVCTLGNELFFEIVKDIKDGNINKAKQKAKKAQENQGFVGEK